MSVARAAPFVLGALLIGTRASAVETVFVPGGDGTTMLATDLYLKDRTARPVLVMRGANARSGAASGIGSLWPESAAYDLVVQDVRGSGGSQGTQLLFSEDGDDGRALLSYLDQQSWSNKRVAMQGWSNAGIADYTAAPGAPASLLGIMPHYATGDLLHYGLFTGGVRHRETADPMAYSASWQAYASLPMWKKLLVDDAQAAAVNAVGLHRGGWFDAFGQGTLDSFSRVQTAGGPNARGRQKVVIGPWTHGGGASETVGELTFPSSAVAASPLPALSQALQKGVFTGDWSTWNALDAVNVYVMGASPGGSWKTYATWPPPAVEVPLYFTTKHGLAAAPDGPSKLSFVSDPSQPCPTIGGTNNLCTPAGPYDQRPMESRSDVVLFTSEPTQTAATIAGRIHAEVWIQTDLPDVDLFLRMTDVYPDGRSMLVAQGIERARYRDGTCPSMLPNKVPARIDVDLESTAWVLAVGHEIRLIVSAAAGPGLASGSVCASYSNAPLYAVNPQNGDEDIGTSPSRSGAIDVLIGTSTPSALVVPVAGGAQVPPDRRPVTQPCAASAADGGAGDSSDAGAEGAAGASNAPSTGGAPPSDGDLDPSPGCECELGRSRHAYGAAPLALLGAALLLSTISGRRSRSRP